MNALGTPAEKNVDFGTEPEEDYAEDHDFNWDTEDVSEKADPEAPTPHQKPLKRLIWWIAALPRFVRLSLIAIVGGAICIVPFIVVYTGFSDNNARPHVEVWSIWITIMWVTSVYTFLVFQWIPTLLVKAVDMVLGRVPDSFQDVLYILNGILLYVKLVFCTVWAWASLGGTLSVEFTDETRPNYFDTVENIVKATFATSIILLAEKIVLKMITRDFHKTSFSERLSNSSLAFRILAKLQKGSKYTAMQEFNSRAYSVGTKARYFFSRNTPAAESAANSIQGRQTKKKAFISQLQTALAAASRKTQLSNINMPESSLAARRLAKELFVTHSKDGLCITPQDLAPYFQTDTDVQRAFALFCPDHKGIVTRKGMCNALQQIFEERTMLNNSMHDMHGAFRALDMVLMCIGLIICVFIWLVIFTGASAVSNLLPLSTIVVGFSFVFGNSAKNIFESMVFIFSTHPYDVGDLVCVEKTWMYVTAFGMISTEFVTVFNQALICPNAVLAAKMTIYNARRSAAQWDSTTIMIGFATPLEKIDEFRQHLTAYVRDDDNFGGGLYLLYDSVRNMNCISMVIAWEHKNNWQDWTRRWVRRDMFMRRMKQIAENLSISYQPPQQPIFFAPEPKTGAHAEMRYGNNLLNTMQVPGDMPIRPTALHPTG
ncbi:hypothetical protein MVES1_000910 [Malassezia vespertilionis]|uniref:EF-hand domain-containing protein n=1 Tax=Malassezia vespertilionis TaxID=2020962 RepID=A0A2N1JE07_9BASI|nr:uncharacterized protein MVES1_000910 [Malassezia vespertilionis]PKI84781.1 hypothetical protein MVES_000858 [Malassezia vespertilionis]WFD05580.1 hypothetical protein MVES1_000910 [Malassezia vespertilionis]